MSRYAKILKLMLAWHNEAVGDKETIDAIEALIPTWTKVKDGLPDKIGFYWLTNRDGEQVWYGAGFYDPADQESGFDSVRNMPLVVTHWQRITPPEEA